MLGVEGGLPATVESPQQASLGSLVSFRLTRQAPELVNFDKRGRVAIDKSTAREGELAKVARNMRNPVTSRKIAYRQVD